MRFLFIIPAALLALASCKPATPANTESVLNGSWKLVSSRSIVKKDHEICNYLKINLLSIM